MRQTPLTVSDISNFLPTVGKAAKLIGLDNSVQMSSDADLLAKLATWLSAQLAISPAPTAMWKDWREVEHFLQSLDEATLEVVCVGDCAWVEAAQPEAPWSLVHELLTRIMEEALA